jgi:crotonobetainyl-CoA:carnitine CoA-transferase CaiB-like acyl-CoA transferase
VVTAPARLGALLDAVGAGDLAGAVGEHAAVDGALAGGPAARWARSGLLALTGPADGPPRLPAVDHLAGIEALLGAVRVLGAARGTPIAVDHRVVVERAALSGLRRAGATSCGGSTRLLPAADGWLALCLARDDDVDLVPAWLGVEPGGDPWEAVASAVATQGAALVEAAGQELGLPVSVVPTRGGAASSGPVRVHRWGTPAAVPDRPLVVDLSSLWAGPLCAQLLGLAGARVVKVESTRRPDGARRGAAGFYRRLHAGHEAVALDLATPRGRDRLRALLEAADVVLEGSRPRALEQLGIEPMAVLSAHPGAVWVSVTGHGRTGPRRQWVGFGDDAAAGAGLLAGTPEAPLFCGDALADPVAGLAAAAGVLASWRRGGGELVDVALAGAARWVAAGPALRGVTVEGAGPDGGHVAVDADGTRTPVAAPVPRPAPAAPAPPPGADTEAVLAELRVA